MLQTIKLQNKALCLAENNNELFIGDARGLIIKVSAPFLITECILTAHAPISSIIFVKDEMFYATWDGLVYKNGKKVIQSKKLGRDAIKCMIEFNGEIYVSIDLKLIVLDLNLDIIHSYDTEYKICCMHKTEFELKFGLITGMISGFKDTYIPASKTLHETTILCIKNDLTGSADGSLYKKNKILYKDIGWIRSIHNENLFSSGKNVVMSNKVIYTHDNEVTGVIKINDTIISIGLDYCYKIYKEGIFLSKEKEDDIMNYINS